MDGITDCFAMKKKNPAFSLEFKAVSGVILETPFRQCTLIPLNNRLIIGQMTRSLWTSCFFFSHYKVELCGRVIMCLQLHFIFKQWVAKGSVEFGSPLLVILHMSFSHQ